MTILVVDDDPDVRFDLGRALERLGDDWEVLFAGTAREALAMAASPAVECVVLDYRLPDGDGLTVLRALKRARPDLTVVMVTGTGSEDIAVEAMKAGAADYVPKQATYALAVPGRVRLALGRRALTRFASPGDAAAARELPAVDAATRRRFEGDGFVTRSPAMLRVFGLIERAARGDVNVLIEGESGTGKELCARAIHAHGPRVKRPFVAVNCAAMSETILESELFGHTRGAFTGADRARPGLFEQADGGTLFLDEIGEASAGVQAKLLRVLQDGEIRPVGATAARRVDVRIVSATNRDLRQETDTGRFRLDLLYRLSVFPIALPALRERREDIGLLAEHFMTRAASDAAIPIGGLHPDTLALMERYWWPGNVRELENEVRRMVACATPGARLGPEALKPAISSERTARTTTGASLRQLVEQFAAVVIQDRLQEYDNRKDLTAKSLGIRRESLWKKARSYGLIPPRSDDDEGEEK
jgi:DNA-binding NtrC family response regulator